MSSLGRMRDRRKPATTQSGGLEVTVVARVLGSRHAVACWPAVHRTAAAGDHAEVLKGVGIDQRLGRIRAAGPDVPR